MQWNILTVYLYLFQYDCQYADEEVLYPILREVTVSETRELEVSSVCGLVSASKINCYVSAVNVAGESNQIIASGYTSLSCMYKCYLCVAKKCILPDVSHK